MAEVENVSLLEKSLKLSKNGGIYYGGARVNADERTAVLFVGLGGSGADVVIRVKDQIKSRMVLPADESGAPVGDSPKNIGFLAIDTDNTIVNTSYGCAKFDSFGNEFCDISVSSVPNVLIDIKKAKASGVDCWQWLDDDINNVAGAKGAGGIRQIGRMLLMTNIDKVLTKVRGKIDSLTKNNPNINSLLIYVFSGISGGTGAGTFLDMAYILRKVALDKMPNVNVMGYLIMSNVNEMNGGKIESLRSNGFACLKELDYWMASDQHEDRYRQKFPTNSFELNEHNKPFDFCHLLDSSDAIGHNFNYDKILKSVAESTFAYVAGEVGNQEQSTGTMGQMYNNINGYLQSITNKGAYPACYNYLSLGAAKIEIPYTEISTLIAARVFERLNKGMFRNRPNEQDFYRIVYTQLEMQEENIRNALYHNVKAPRPDMSQQSFKHQDVWPGNAPYAAAHNWLALFQRAVMEQAGNMPSYLEGNLRGFIQRCLKDTATGPIYLRYFLNSTENFCLYKMLENTKIYCKRLQVQCEGQAKEMSDRMAQAYAEGANIGFGGNKKKATDYYLSTVEAWYRNEEHAFLNRYIVEIIDKIQKRVELYYENILRPLSDVLNELPAIFEENVNYIRVAEDNVKVDESVDILIRPLVFERTNIAAFKAAVDSAEKEFLNSLSKNIRKWIGRDIDHVDENISPNVDVAGFISGFITDNFSALLTINMEKIMLTKLAPGQSLAEYVEGKIDKMVKSSFTMFKENSGLAQKPEDFSILSVPNDCPQIYAVAQNYKQRLSLKNLMIKKSEELNRLYIIKAASGYPLFSDAYLEEMEKAYEGEMASATSRSGKHLNPEWADRLPSPYTHLAWRTPYECKRTKERNERFQGYFDRGVETGIISRKGDVYALKKADPEVLKICDRSSLTAPTTIEKVEQFERIKARLWREDNIVKLSGCSSYKLAQENGLLQNIRENILRFPKTLDILENECRLSEKIKAIDDELQYPKWFALANANHLIYENEITGDTSYRRTETDPFPIKLTNGSEMKEEYRDYQIFVSFCKQINDKMRTEIDTQYGFLKEQIQIDPDKLKAYVDELNERISLFGKEAEKARLAMFTKGTEEQAGYLTIIDFYRSVAEEMNRMLPGRKANGTSASGQNTGKSSVSGQQSAYGQQGNPMRFLDLKSWQPVQNPQYGQFVFDTAFMKPVQFNPALLNMELPKYMDLQSWQPIQNPQPGQWVFDVAAGMPTAYQPAMPQYPGYPGMQQGGYPGMQQSGYPGMQQSGYQEAQQGGYPGMQQGGYPGMQQSGYQEVQQGGYPGMQQSSYQEVQQGGYPGMQQGGYPGAQQGGYPGMQQGGYPGAQQGGYAGNQQEGYPGNQGGFPGGPYDYGKKEY